MRHTRLSSWPLILLLASCSGLSPEPDTGPSAADAERAAQIQAELEAASARIAELEGKVADAESRPAPPVSLPTVEVWPSGIPAPTGRAEKLEGKAEVVESRFNQFHDWNPESRLYIQVDRPLYQPGDTIWVKTWDVAARTLEGSRDGVVTYALLGPRGGTVQEKKVRVSDGMSAGDFILGDVVGGEYKVQVSTEDGALLQRPVVVSRYEPPRVKKTLDFLRESYGPGEAVTATIHVERAAGGALADAPLTAVVQVEGREVERLELTTDASGGAVATFTLPDAISVADGLLTLLVPDGGVTESISRSIPIVLDDYSLTLFPEGGDLIAGLPSRVYFESADSRGEPVDVSGHVLDSQGRIVSRFDSLVGRGHFTLTPDPDEAYRVIVTSPAKTPTEARAAFPAVQPSGCTLSTFDDPGEVLDAIVVGVRCTEERELILASSLRERVMDVAQTTVPAGEDGVVVYLRAEDEALRDAIGVARVTAFDTELRPLAERLVFRNRSRQLQVSVETEARYTPRDTVEMTLRATTPEGKPVRAELAVAVVDDAVLNLADDTRGHMLSRLYLMPELRAGAELDEPNRYFDVEDPDSARAMDLLLATRGWRRFDWSVMLSPDTDGDTFVDALDGCPEAAEDTDDFQDEDGCPDPDNDFDGVLDVDDKCPLEPELVNGYKDDDGCPEKDTDGDGYVDGLDKCRTKAETWNGYKDDDGCPDERELRKKIAAGEFNGGFGALGAGGMGMKGAGMGGGGGVGMARIGRARPAVKPRQLARRPVKAKEGKDIGDVAEAADAPAPDEEGVWPVRQFPVPRYTKRDAPATRDDFRQTIYWNHAVTTNRRGVATLSFPVSDAITSFRVTAEGIGGGLAGRAEHVFESILPMSLAAKLPLEVSAGDHLELPITLSNEQDAALVLDLQASFGDLVTLTEGAHEGGGLSHRVKLEPRSRDTLFVPLDVTGVRGESEVRIAAQGEGLTDSYARTLKVVPRGFPQVTSVSGRVQGSVTETLTIANPVPGTAFASVRVFPTPAASLQGGMEGMLREPSGCFEQTSSSNYPNIMVMRYMEKNDAVDPQLLQRSGELLDKGYKRLVGYESPERGYEWFGGDPGHEALTAYGLVEFVAMRDLYPVDQDMIDRTADWLLSRRDGEGGFKRNPKALDAFGGAAPEVTDAYVTWSLSEAGYHDLPAELDRQKALARDSQDPYLLALASNTFLNLPESRDQGIRAAQRLAALQGDDGAFTSPGHSITRSSGVNLTIETTALAATALMKADVEPEAVERAMGWIHNNRGGFGQWGATQATVLALDAMTRYAEWSSSAQEAGAIVLTVNGQRAGRVEFEAGHADPIVFDDIAHLLQRGDNTFTLTIEGDTRLAYAMAAEYNSEQPDDSPEAVVDLTTSFDKTQAPMGETVRLTATLTNTTDSGQPMTLMRLGLPSGLTVQDWQLRELRDKGHFDFYETRAREIILYYRALAPSAQRSVELDLVATLPSTTTGPASQAYLYYTNEHRKWAPGLDFTVTRR